MNKMPPTTRKRLSMNNYMVEEEDIQDITEYDPDISLTELQEEAEALFSIHGMDYSFSVNADEDNIYGDNNATTKLPKQDPLKEEEEEEEPASEHSSSSSSSLSFPNNNNDTTQPLRRNSTHHPVVPETPAMNMCRRERQKELRSISLLDPTELETIRAERRASISKLIEDYKSDKQVDVIASPLVIPTEQLYEEAAAAAGHDEEEIKEEKEALLAIHGIDVAEDKLPFLSSYHPQGRRFSAPTASLMAGRMMQTTNTPLDKENTLPQKNQQPPPPDSKRQPIRRHHSMDHQTGGRSKPFLDEKEVAQIKDQMIYQHDYHCSDYQPEGTTTTTTTTTTKVGSRLSFLASFLPSRRMRNSQTAGVGDGSPQTTQTQTTKTKATRANDQPTEAQRKEEVLRESCGYNDDDASSSTPSEETNVITNQTIMVEQQRRNSTSMIPRGNDSSRKNTNVIEKVISSCEEEESLFASGNASAGVVSVPSNHRHRVHRSNSMSAMLRPLKMSPSTKTKAYTNDENMQRKRMTWLRRQAASYRGNAQEPDEEDVGKIELLFDSLEPARSKSMFADETMTTVTSNSCTSNNFNNSCTSMLSSNESNSNNKHKNKTIRKIRKRGKQTMELEGGDQSQSQSHTTTTKNTKIPVNRSRRVKGDFSERFEDESEALYNIYGDDFIAIFGEGVAGTHTAADEEERERRLEELRKRNKAKVNTTTTTISNPAKNNTKKSSTTTRTRKGFLASLGDELL